MDNLTPVDFILGPQVPSGTSWFDRTQITKGKIHGEAFPNPPPAAYSDAYILAHYYDLAQSMYAAHKRSNDPQFQSLGRKVADSWWASSWWIGSGSVRMWPDSAAPAPRHAGVGGLILRALDGKPEYWDWINSYTRFHLDHWCKKRLNDNALFYGVREGAFALHYGIWLAKALPDSFPLQAGGTVTNGAALRTAYLTDCEAIATQYYGRLQQADGSWRWDDVDYRDTDGGTLKGIMQPFMIGLLMGALIDIHRLSTNVTIKTNIQNQITKACRHLYEGGPYRKDEAVPADASRRWRAFWYFYHGGTTVNPTKYANGGGSESGSQIWHVSSERQSISTIFSAYAYAYLLTGDPIYKTMGDELFDAAFVGSDGIRNLADGTPKNYNQNYRRGGSYLAWIKETPPEPPTPEPPDPEPPEPPVVARPIIEYQSFHAGSHDKRLEIMQREGADGWWCDPHGDYVYCKREKVLDGSEP